MRKFMISLLVASALTPAAALADEGGFVRGMRAQGERASQRDTSSDDRPQRAQHNERSGDDHAVRVERAERPVRTENSDHQVRFDHGGQQSAPTQQVEQVQQVQPEQRVRRTDRHGDGFFGGIREAGREAQASQQGQVEVHRDRGGFSGLHDRIVEHGDRTDSHNRWNGDWRHDHRYDWRSHRSRYGSLYRYGRYYDPYGWGYRRFSIGFNLWPSYYGSNNWLNDPWQYRLPPAYGPYRWVRYYDDALLVNIYSGQVVDVVYNFFW